MTKTLAFCSVFALLAFTAVGCRTTVYRTAPPSSPPPAEAAPASDGTEETPGEAEATADPPAPQAEVIVVETRPTPNHVWIGGHWAWHGHWMWIGGHWHVGRVGHVWVPGHWVAAGHHRHRWVPGHWRK